MWWGFSPAIDILREVNEPEINVLLVSQSDCRHVLQTLSNRYLHADVQKVKFYVFEPRLENIARSLLFTTLALDSQLGLGMKCQHFMELLGNTLVRQSAWQYLQEASNRLVKVVTNFNYSQNILPSISLDNLRYKERDQLENIFKFWSAQESEFDIVQFWDQRVRTHLGTRYDSRVGVFDWDLHMRYRPFGGESVSATEYKVFREKGITYLQEDSDPCLANKTLTTFKPGCVAPAPGYFGDILTGPYPTFGLDSEDKDLLKKVNGHNWKTATEISECNIQKMFYELSNGKPFKAPQEDAQCPVLKKDESQKIVTRKPVWRRIALGDSYTSIPTRNSEILFLPITAMKDYPTKQQFRGFFDVVTIGHNYVSELPSNWSTLCKPTCKVLVESARFLLDLRKDDLVKDKLSIDNAMTNVGLEPCAEYDQKVDDVMKYQFSNV